MTDARAARVLATATALLLHRNGPTATVWQPTAATDPELTRCAQLAADLDAKVVAALSRQEAFHDAIDVSEPR